MQCFVSPGQAQEMALFVKIQKVCLAPYTMSFSATILFSIHSFVMPELQDKYILFEYGHKNSEAINAPKICSKTKKTL